MLQTVVLHERGTQATGTDDYCIMMAAEAQKILQLGDQTLHLIANAGLALHIQERQVLGNL